MFNGQNRPVLSVVVQRPEWGRFVTPGQRPKRVRPDTWLRLRQPFSEF